MRWFNLLLATLTLLMPVALTASVSANSNSADATVVVAARVSSMRPQAQEQLTLESARRITVEELRAALERRTAIVIDVRDSESFKSAHIKGALHIPEDRIISRIKKLPRNKLIVTYCS